MMWGYGDFGLIWLLGLLLLVGIALLVLVAVRLFAGGGDHGRVGPSGYGAREILDERFAKGELTAEQYREQLRVLNENR